MNEPLDLEYTKSLWDRALDALKSAESATGSLDCAANRAYYAAFHAVSALFAAEGHYFKKHSGVRSAVHQHLINTGRFASELGSGYDRLLELRSKADYGGVEHATPDEVAAAVPAARRILKAVHNEHPDIFPLEPRFGELDFSS